MINLSTLDIIGKFVVFCTLSLSFCDAALALNPGQTVCDSDGWVDDSAPGNGLFGYSNCCTASRMSGGCYGVTCTSSIYSNGEENISYSGRLVCPAV